MVSGESEVVIEKRLGRTRLPDGALDLSQWIRDGRDVYNLFVYMKPLFYAMLRSMPEQTFRMSWKEAGKVERDQQRYRLSLREEQVGASGDPDYDRILVAELVPPGAPVKKGYGDEDWLPPEDRPDSQLESAAPDCKRDGRKSWCVTHAAKWPRGYGECVSAGRW